VVADAGRQKVPVVVADVYVGQVRGIVDSEIIKTIGMQDDCTSCSAAIVLYGKEQPACRLNVLVE
jgi:hypothetical protein